MTKIVPARPAGMDTERLFSQVPSWHQRWEIFEGVFTPGRNPVEDMMQRADVPRDLTGARVLDVGAFNGCCALECERRGAEEVVAIDLNPPEHVGFTVLRDAVGSRRVQFRMGSAYSLDHVALGEFDVVLFFGVLYHLRYPLLAIDQLRKVTKGTVYVETLVIDNRFLTADGDFGRLAAYHPALLDVPLWQFYKGEELSGDASNWFGPNIRAVLDAFESAGFAVGLTAAWSDRAAFQARPAGRGTIEQSYEGMSHMLRLQLGLE